MSFLENFFKDEEAVKVNSHGKTEDNKRPVFRTVVNCSIMAAMAVTIASGAFAPKTVHASELNTKSPVAYEQVLEKKNDVEAIYLNSMNNSNEFIKISNEGIEFLNTKESKINENNLAISLKNADWIHVSERMENSPPPFIKAELEKLKTDFGLDLNKRLENSSDFMEQLGIPKEIQSLSKYKNNVNYNFSADSTLESYANLIKNKTGIDISKTDDYKSLVNERLESMKDIREYNVIRDSVIIKYASQVEDTSWIFKEDPIKVAEDAYKEINFYVSNQSTGIPKLSENKQISNAQEAIKYNYYDTVNFAESMALGMGNRSQNDIGLRLTNLRSLFEPIKELQGDLYKATNETKDYTTDKFADTVVHKKDGSYTTYTFGVIDNVYDKDGNLTYTSLPDTYQKDMKTAQELNLEKAEGKLQEIHIGNI